MHFKVASKQKIAILDAHGRTCSLCGQPSVVSEVEPVGLREQKKTRELEIARNILSLEPRKRLATWQRKTGKGQATLYRRLAELGKIDAQEFDV